MKVSLIAAVARNGVIGCENRLPWHLPEDLKHFKQLTLGKPVLMGRKTFESIGRPLPGRRNIVITRNPSWQHAGVEVAYSVEAALAACAGLEEAVVIGGAQIYAQAMSAATDLYLTRVEAEPEGDASFPPLATSEWTLTTTDTAGSSGGLAFHFEHWRRV